MLKRIIESIPKTIQFNFHEHQPCLVLNSKYEHDITPEQDGENIRVNIMPALHSLKLFSNLSKAS